MLNNAQILIVEDEPYIALELQTSVEDAGGQVLGPTGSVAGALALLASCAVSAAILDIRLSDGDVTPVARVLVERGIPVVIQSGTNPPPELRRLVPEEILYKKPTSPHLLIEKLAALLKP